MTDRNIIELLFARDEIALDQIATRYGSLLLQLSRRILGNTEDAPAQLPFDLSRTKATLTLSPTPRGLVAASPAAGPPPQARQKTAKKQMPP